MQRSLVPSAAPLFGAQPDPSEVEALLRETLRSLRPVEVVLPGSLADERARVQALVDSQDVTSTGRALDLAVNHQGDDVLQLGLANALAYNSGQARPVLKSLGAEDLLGAVSQTRFELAELLYMRAAQKGNLEGMRGYAGYLRDRANASKVWFPQRLKARALAAARFLERNHYNEDASAIRSGVLVGLIEAPFVHRMVDHEYQRLFDTTRIEHLPDTAAERLWSDDPELLDALPMIAGKIDPQLSGVSAHRPHTRRDAA
ncbi:MAG: hypothetical protein KC476_05420 [Cyanobacteria bacterium HKST-UBA06]|nr:hypothetical protein [Cyanobacteria bacterium HKST-UBA06]